MVGLLRCAPWHRPSADVDAGARSDLAWAAAREPADLDAVEAPLLAALAEDPADVEALWRLARVELLQADLVPAGEEGRVDHARLAREYGVRCLLADAGLAALAAREPGGFGPKAAAAANDGTCASWAALAWARWAEARGPAASVDAPTLRALAERAVALRPEDARAHEALGLALALDPVNPDLSGARAALERAAALDPGSPLPRVEAAALGAAAGEEPARRVLREAAGGAVRCAIPLECLAARNRAARDLSAADEAVDWAAVRRQLEATRAGLLEAREAPPTE